MKMLSLFSGIGGIDLAGEWAGMETVAFCEYHPIRQKVLKKHWPNVPVFEDIFTLTKEVLDNAGIETIDIVAGGYPCQPFSSAGKRGGTEDDRYLWPEMFRLVKELQPRWVVGENVAYHVELGLDETLSDLESEGYAWETFVVPACAIDAEHERKRVFIVANSTSIRWDSLEKECKSRCSKFDFPMLEQGGHIADNLLLDLARIFTNPRSGIKRNDDGISEGLDRLEGIGNAVMPQQIYPIMKGIMEIEKLLERG